MRISDWSSDVCSSDLARGMQGIEDVKLEVVGLGYVGLPVAVASGGRLPTIGFDIKRKRIAELKSGRAITNEVTPEYRKSAVEGTSVSGRVGPGGVRRMNKRTTQRE